MSMAGETDIPLFTYSFFDAPFWDKPDQWLAHSSLMYVGKVTTPTMLMTGELDRRTPIPQSEEYFAALKVRHVPAVVVRVSRGVPRHWLETFELHADAALHDELVPEVERTAEPAGDGNGEQLGRRR